MEREVLPERKTVEVEEDERWIWRQQRETPSWRGWMAGDGGSLAVERGGDDGGGMRIWRRGWRHGGPEATAAAA